MSRNNRFKNQIPKPSYPSDKNHLMKTIKIDNEVMNDKSSSMDYAEAKLLDAVNSYLKTTNLDRKHYHSIMICLQCDLVLLNELSAD